MKKPVFSCSSSAIESTRRLASRVVTYLILRAVGDLTPLNNPASADAWCTRLMATDAFDWTSEGLTGGAYRKVIRWAFEVQGLFRPPGAPNTDPGAPPQVDVYIDDGRTGTYLPYLADFADIERAFVFFNLGLNDRGDFVCVEFHLRLFSLGGEPRMTRIAQIRSGETTTWSFLIRAIRGIRGSPSR